MPSPLIIETGKITTLTLNRPNKCNALNAALVDTLTSLLDTLAKDKAIDVVVLRAAGQHFCAGADLNTMHNITQGAQVDNEQDAERLAALFYQLYTLPHPTLALVQGAALGGGAGLAACCDWCIADENAYFGFPEVRLGLIPAVIAPYVSAAIGPRYTKSFFMTSEAFSAHQALQMGLVYKIVKQEILNQTSAAFCSKLLNNSLDAIRQAKALINTVVAPIDSALQKKTSQQLAAIRAGDGAKKTLSVFLHQQPPKTQ